MALSVKARQSIPKEGQKTTNNTMVELSRNQMQPNIDYNDQKTSMFNE